YLGRPGLVTYPDGTSAWTDAAEAAEIFYHDCAIDVARRAFARLRRQAQTPRNEPCPLRAWPDTRLVSILCRDDHAISPDWSRRVARERLGVPALELPGSHSSFASRPGDLAVLLDAVAG